MKPRASPTCLDSIQRMRTGIPFSILAPGRARRQILKVIVYDPENDRVGSKLIKMK